MKQILKWVAIGFVGLVVIVAIAGGGESTDNDGDGQSLNGNAEPTQQAEEEPAREAEPEPEPEAEPENPDGEYDLNCAYEIGGGTTEDPFAGYRFTAGGTLMNTGNTNIRVRVTYQWKRLGSSPKTVRKTYRVREGHERDVNISVKATQPDISAHQNADAECKATARIVGTF